MKFIKRLKVGLVLALLAGVAWAVEYSFIVPGITYDSDTGAEYHGAVTLFLNVQGKGVNFKPDDKISFTYADGTIATFELNRDLGRCVFGRCVWATTRPFSNGNIPIKVVPHMVKLTDGVGFPEGDRYAGALAAAKASGWVGSAAVPSKPIYMPGISLPIGFLWDGGVLTTLPVAPLDPSRATITVGPVTVIDNSTGTSVTSTGSVDLNGGGSFTIILNPDGAGDTGTVYDGGQLPGCNDGLCEPFRVTTLRHAQRVIVRNPRDPCAANRQACR